MPNNKRPANACAAALDAYIPRPAPVQTVTLSGAWLGLASQPAARSISAPDKVKKNTADNTGAGLVEYIEVDTLRLDQVDTEFGGNKWFKLYPHLRAAAAGGHTTLISFGGAHSNHLHALAAAAKRFGFGCIGVVRGERPATAPLTPTLEDASRWGMRLEFVSRSEYAQRYDMDWCAALAAKHAAYLIPEGGASTLALEGLRNLAEQIDSGYNTIVLPCGTGTTLAGLACHLSAHQQLIGVSALKDGGSTQQRVAQLQGGVSGGARWRISQEHHGGGFAKLNSELLGFLDCFEQHNEFQLDPVYNAKSWFAVTQWLCQASQRAAMGKVLVLNTGGLQGRRALEPTMQKTRAARSATQRTQ